MNLQKLSLAALQFKLPFDLRKELRNPAALGGRHHQMTRLAPSLIGLGCSAEQVFQLFRRMYANDMADDEIADVVNWAAGVGTNGTNEPRAKIVTASKGTRTSVQHISPEIALHNVRNALGAFVATEADLARRSPMPLPANWQWGAVSLVSSLFGPGEHINIVSTYELGTDPDGTPKAKPRGAGRTLTRDRWLSAFPSFLAQLNAGAWVRMNPVKPIGSGAGGAPIDADVTSFRHVLVEFDHLLIEFQLSLLALLPLPIAATITSGRRSVHAWVQINAISAEEYRERAKEILSGLSQFGVCPGNSNPSRLSRLPGAYRGLDGCADPRQRLLFLNSNPVAIPIHQIHPN